MHMQLKRGGELGGGPTNMYTNMGRGTWGEARKAPLTRVATFSSLKPVLR